MHIPYLMTKYFILFIFLFIGVLVKKAKEQEESGNSIETTPESLPPKKSAPGLDDIDQEKNRVKNSSYNMQCGVHKSLH